MLDSILVYVVALGLPLWVVLQWARSRRRVRPPTAESTWRAAAAALGLAVTRDPGAAALRISGTLDGFEVEVGSGPAGQGTRFVVHGRGLPAGLSIGAESLLGQAGAGVVGSDLQTAHREFDNCIHLLGAEAETVAVLDEDTRDLVLSFVERGGSRIAEDGIRLEIPEPVVREEEIITALRELVGLARRLSLEGRSVPALLCANATQDEVPAVRRRNLELLLREFPQAPETERACAWTVANAADGEALSRAADLLGLAVLPQLAALIRSDAAPAEVRTAGVQRLVQSAPREEAIPVLMRVLEEDAGRLWGPAALGLGTLRHAPALDLILRRLDGIDAPTAAACAEALGLLGDARAEPALIGLLRREAEAVRVATIVALGKLGGTRSVAPLTACARETSRFWGADLRRHAWSALDAICARLGDAGAGHLSLADSVQDSGALSLARDGGSLSIAAGEVQADPPVEERRCEPEDEGSRI